MGAAWERYATCESALIDVSVLSCVSSESARRNFVARAHGDLGVRVLPEDKPCCELTDLSELAQAQCDKQFVLRLLALGCSWVCLSAAHE